MRNFLLILLLFTFHQHGNAQSLHKDSLFMPSGVRQFQFQLEKPVKSIDNLRYDQSNEPIKGTLSPDGSRVTLDNYKKGQRVKFNVVHLDGKLEELTKSPCFIDPVSYDL